MILQYLSKTDEGTTETTEDGVISVDVNKEKKYVEVAFQRNERLDTRRFYTENIQIYNMWLLNDNFKTLKKLI